MAKETGDQRSDAGARSVPTAGRSPRDRADLAALLARSGFVSAEEEAAELIDAAAGDASRLEAMVVRRLTGEPLAWITGRTTFCDLAVSVHHGVYVPRWQSQELALRAAARLPEAGMGVDLCTGSGAIAMVMTAARPAARVLASDLDHRAVACARANGVEAFAGDLFASLPLPPGGALDVVVGVVPYVPTSDLPLLQRDTFTFETELAYDGGDDGTRILRRAITESAERLRAGGALLLELGGDQADLLRPLFTDLGFADLDVLIDEDGDVRGIEATRRRA